MAIVLKDRFNLPALIPRIERSRSEDRLILTLQQGREQIADVSLPLDATGIPERLGRRAIAHAAMSLPQTPELDDLFNTTLDVIQGNLPIVWLHLYRSEPRLAFFPWEKVLAERLKDYARVMRIPNFVEDPFEFGPTVRYVICASAPVAKGPYDLIPLIGHALEQLRLQKRAEKMEVHVFTDFIAWEHGRDQFTGFSRPDDGFRVIVYDPHDAGIYETQESTRRIDGAVSDLSNPWLLWMKDALKGLPIDLVHFVSPGYFDQMDGAMALAVSPLDNSDYSWSRFVGAAELSRFLDTLGAQGLGLHALSDDVWATGLRLLAWQMTWQRPGPLLSCRDVMARGLAELGELHRVLTEGMSEPLDIADDTFLNIHPMHLSASELPLELESVASTYENLSGISTLEEATQSIASDLFNRSLKSVETRLERGNSGDRGQSVVLEPWVELATRRIDSRRAQMTSVKPKSSRDLNENIGAMQALDFVSDLLREHDTVSGSSGTVSSEEEQGFLKDE